jgi:hypothetical protein
MTVSEGFDRRRTRQPRLTLKRESIEHHGKTRARSYASMVATSDGGVQIMDARPQHRKVWKGLAAGMAAGLMASWTMSQFQT